MILLEQEGKTDETFAAPSGGFLLMRLDRCACIHLACPVACISV